MMRIALAFGMAGILCSGVSTQSYAECGCQGSAPVAHTGACDGGCVAAAEPCCGETGCAAAPCGDVGCSADVCGAAVCGCGCATGGCGCNPGEFTIGCCDGAEAIDVDSLTDAAQSKMLFESSQARIVVELPENADVSFLDQKMTLLGGKRSFLVPLLDQNKAYKYDLRVDVVRNGKKYFKKVKRDDLRAGMIINVKVAVEAPEGEHAKIDVAQEVVMKGGPPAKDEDEKGEEKGEGEATAGLIRGIMGMMR